MTASILINVNLGGNLGNQFLNHLWMLEIARQTGVTVLNPILSKYSSWFDNLPINSIYISPGIHKKIKWYQSIFLFIFINYTCRSIVSHIKIVYKIRLFSFFRYLFPLNTIIGYIAFDWLLVDSAKSVWLPPTLCKDGAALFFGPEISALLTRYRIIVLDSAAIIPDYSYIHPDTFCLAKQYFKPKQVFEKPAITLQQDCRIQGTLLIGVSIRQGDFKHWQGGIFHVEAVSFVPILSQFISTLNQPHLLVICSDDSLDKDLFNSFNAFYPESLPPLHLAYLMYCDYIIGTEGSTFIQMASSLGNVPLYGVNKSNISNNISFASFRVALT